MISALRFWRVLLTAVALLGAPPAFADTNLVWSCTNATVGSPVTSCAGTASWQKGMDGKLVASATTYGAFNTGTWRLWENVPLDEYVYVCASNVTIGSTAPCPEFGGLTVERFLIKSSLAPPTASLRVGTAALVSTTDANSAIPTGTTHTNSIGTTGRPAEIVELARALRNNPDFIYDYVRNNVDTVWMYGLQKGAVGAIVDKSGTPFDQAHLMVELLREAGFTATYQVGTITLTGAQFQQWTGTTNARAACNLLSSGGIPASINGSTNLTSCTTISGALTTVVMAHIWVSVSIGGGGPYLFDPSYKPYAFKTGVDLNAVADLTSGDALAASGTGMTGGTTGGGVIFKVGLGAGQLYDLLEDYADNLLGHINTNFPAGEVEDLVGGRKIVRDEAADDGTLRQTTLPYTAAVQRTWSGDVPDQYRTSLRVQVTKGLCTAGFYPTIIDHAFYADDIYARRVVLGGSYQMDGALTTVTLTVKNEAGVGTTIYSDTFNCNPGFNVGEMTLSVNHPYPAAADGTTTLSRDYMDVITTKSVHFATPLVIVTGWGDSGRGLIEKMGLRMDSPLVPLITSGCETCALGFLTSQGDGRREQLAASWLAQSSTAARLHAAIAKSIYQHHHSVGIVEGESEVRGFPVNFPNPTGEYRYTIIDSFDRFDIDTGISLTSKSAAGLERRPAVLAIAETIDALEGSTTAQSADLPDTASTSTRFEWANNPPNGEDFAPTPGTPRRFYEFTSADDDEAASLAKVELRTSTTETGSHTGASPEIGDQELQLRRSRLSSAISRYADLGFEVTAAEDAFLGPGQRAGAFVEDSNGVTWHHRYTKQRSGALVATRYNGGDPVEIAHVTVGSDSNSKGGGGGAQPTTQAQYDPSQAADILKSRFVDRSKVLGVDLYSGSAGASSPASISVGNGGFPYELNASLLWTGGNVQSTSFGPESHTEPRTPWTTNWNNTLTVSGSGMEMMDGDVRALAGTVAAFIAQQDVYSSTPSIHREVTGALVGAWWVRQLTGNITTVNVGADTRQFVRLIDYYNHPEQHVYIAPGAGSFAALTRTGWRSKYEEPPCMTNPVTYATSRGWNYSSVSFQVKNANGDVQNFPYWSGRFDGGSYCAQMHGFRMNSWTFPQGVTVNLAYDDTLGLLEVPELTEVNNTLGRKITFIDSGRSGFNNGLTAGNLRSVSVTGNPKAAGIVTHTEPTGAATKFNVSIVGEKYLVTQVFNALNGTTPSLQYDYDSLRRVKEARDADALQAGNRGPYQFFIGEGVRSQRIDPENGVFSILYDDKKQAFRVIDEIARETSIAHDGRGRVTEYLYPETNREWLKYDDRNNVTSLIRLPKGCTAAASPPYCSPLEHTIQASWNTLWNKPDYIIDARGNRTDFTYVPTGTNGTSLLQQAQRPAPEAGQPRPTYTYTYNARGQRLDFTDPTGLITRNAYFTTSPFNLQTTTLDPGGLNAITTFGYDAIGDTTSISDPRSNVTEPAYDNNRRKTVVKHHDGGIGATLLAAEQTTYDLLGQVTKEEGGTVFSGTNITTWQTISETTYTPTGMVKTSKNGAGDTTTTSYDSVDRVQVVRDPENRKVRSFYDAAGQLLCTWRGWTGSFPGYSGASFGQPCRWDAPTSYPGFGPVRYAEFAYTPNGQRATVKDADNNLSQYVYDSFDLLKELHFPNGTAGSGTASATDYESYLYNENGDRTSLTKRDRTTTIGYTFDALNRVIVKDIPGGTANDVYLEYDPAGRPLSARFVSITGSGVIYGYGPGKRLISEATFGRSVGFDYDLAGNRTKVIWPDGNWVYSNFDNLNRVTKVCENGAAGCGTGLLVTYTLDPLSRRDSISRPNTTSSDFDYDLASRLTLLTQNVSGTTNDLSRTFTYNLAGQLKTRVNTTAAHWLAATPGSSAYAANGRNQYTTVAGATFGYDLNGNLTSTGTRSYGYDAENRLTSVSGGASLTLTYDPLGRLRQTTAGATTTDFLYEGDRLLAEYNGATLLRRYAHGPGVDEPIVWYEGSGLTPKRWLHPDERGSVVAWTDSGGAATVYRYGPYGEPSGGDFTGSRFRYTGQIALPEVGLYHYKARAYDPAIGRFLQTDPVGYQDDFNLYTYVYNDPFRRTDPDGLYGRGTGFTDAEWKKFDRAQQAAAKGMERMVAKIDKALSTGKGLKSVSKQFEKVFGKGTATTANMQQVSSTLQAMAGKLRDTGSAGNMANALTAAGTLAAGASSSNVLMFVYPGSTNTINVNVGHPDFGNSLVMRWGAGHEPAHNLGLHDERVNNVSAYKHSPNPAERQAFRDLSTVDPTRALVNPDHFSDLAQPDP